MNIIKIYKLLTEVKESLTERFLEPSITKDIREEVSKIQKVLDIIEGETL